MKKQGFEKLKARQIQAASMIAAGKCHADVARVLNCSASLISQWAVKPEFREAVLEAKRQIFTECLTDLQGYAADMVKELKKIAEDEEHGVQARIRAITAMLDYAFRAREIETIERRLEVLENVVSKSENPVEKIGRPDANLVYTVGRDDRATLPAGR